MPIRNWCLYDMGVEEIDSSLINGDMARFTGGGGWSFIYRIILGRVIWAPSSSSTRRLRVGVC